MKQRMITAILAGTGFMLLLFFAENLFAGLLILLAGIGFREYARMNNIGASEPVFWLGLAGTVYLALPRTEPWLFPLPDWHIAVWPLLFLLLAATVISRNRVTIDHVSFLFAGVLYIGLGFHYMIETRLVPEHGLFWTLFVFTAIWMTDSGAYFTGMTLGRRKLWPAISPNKTVEGAIGAIIASVFTALAFAWYAPELLSYSKAIGVGVAIGVVAQLGDLIQSAYKRAKGIKDTGTLLPGHGGVLDRCDSWLIVFPFLHLLEMISF